MTFNVANVISSTPPLNLLPQGQNLHTDPLSSPIMPQSDTSDIEPNQSATPFGPKEGENQ